MTVTYFTNIAQYNNIIKQLRQTLTFVEFSATWCPPCRFMGPYYDKYSDEYEKALFYKIQSGDEPDLEKDEVSQEAGITSIPTFIAFKGDELERRSSGDPHELQAFIERHYRRQWRGGGRGEGTRNDVIEEKTPKTKSCDDSAGQFPNRVGASWMRFLGLRICWIWGWLLSIVAFLAFSATEENGHI